MQQRMWVWHVVMVWYAAHASHRAPPYQTVVVKATAWYVSPAHSIVCFETVQLYLLPADATATHYLLLQ